MYFKPLDLDTVCVRKTLSGPLGFDVITWPSNGTDNDVGLCKV